MAHYTKGAYSNLPLEVKHMIFDILDFQSLAILRSLSSSSRIAVESLPNYKYMIADGSDVLTALAITGLLSKFTIAQLVRTINTVHCQLCHNDGGPILFLPTYTRYCMTCLLGDLRLLDPTASEYDLPNGGRRRYCIPQKDSWTLEDGSLGVQVRYKNSRTGQPVKVEIPSGLH